MVRVSRALWLPPPPPPPPHAARDVAAATAMTAAPARTNVGRDMKTLLRESKRDIGVVDTGPPRGAARCEVRHIRPAEAIGCRQLSRAQIQLIDGTDVGDPPGRSGLPRPGFSRHG